MSLPSLHLKDQSLEYDHNLNTTIISLEPFSSILVFVLLHFNDSSSVLKENDLRTNCKYNIRSDHYQIIERSNQFLTSSRIIQVPLLTLVSIGECTPQHPDNPPSDNMSSKYFFRDKDSFLGLATSIPKKYHKDPNFFGLKPL